VCSADDKWKSERNWIQTLFIKKRESDLDGDMTGHWTLIDVANWYSY
jgi:hypothetical protein